MLAKMTPSDHANINEHANTPVWADLISAAPARARDFYSTVFGWRWLEPADETHGWLATTNVTLGAPDIAQHGATGAQSAEQPVAHLHHAVDFPWVSLQSRSAQWVPRFAVKSAVTATRHAQELGARVIDNTEELSLLEDPNSSPFMLMQLGTGSDTSTHAVPSSGTATLASPTISPSLVSPALTWVELRTSERNQTTSFYSQLFSWTTRSADFGSSEYTQFIANGKPVAGMLLSPETVARARAPHWGVTLQVANAEKAIANALEAGGALVYGPMNAEWGISAALTDPSGASFNIVEPIYGKQQS